ncbi:MAG: nicotinate phosphoribosyltransferase [Actinomycetia bacterium]|nr:nicotinate phosphoribosyltransferase [Actinomycetota bacterium]MCG2791333.1 nicotinate phosphoribosyltransferase [Actinomycetes bacterium]
MFHIANADDIKKGRLTDIYFKRTEEILKATGKNPVVKAEIFLKGFPEGYRWGILAGIEETIKLLSDIDKISIRCMPEGTVFKDFQPVMVIEGKYLDFGIYETAILGFLCQASGIATKAARCKLAAGDKLIYSFGARRMHPAITPMVERSAFIGGADGVSTTLGAKLIDQEPVGTIPHALILIMGDTVEATRAFNQVIEPKIKRISLIDTFGDEKFEAIRVAEGLGEALFGIRLDTPASRRGNFKKILEEVRWELDIRGFENVKLVVSGGLDEEDIIKLRDIVYAFGVGTAISGAKVLDFSLDIVEIEGKKISKRGKMSGAKKVIRCQNCFSDRIILEDRKVSDYRCVECNGIYKDIFIDAVKEGKILYDFPQASGIRKNAIGQFQFLEL